MRIVVCLAVCLAGSVQVAAAQSSSGTGGVRRVEAGVKAAVTSFTLNVSGLEGFDPKAGAGAQAGAWISAGRDTVRLQTELTVGTRHFSAASPAGDIDVSARAVDVPVLIVGRFKPGARTRPLVYAGPFFTVVSGVTQTAASVKTDIDDQIQDVDAGTAFGAGLEIGAGRGAIAIDVRYLLGLRDLSASSDTTFKSRTLAVAFGYRF